jgi:hypothetical protein
MVPSASVADRATRRFRKPADREQVRLEQVVGRKPRQRAVQEPPQHRHGGVRFGAIAGGAVKRLIHFESRFEDHLPRSCATCAAAALLARGVGMGTGVNAAAGPLIARTASTVSAIPLLTIRFISDAPISQPGGLRHRCLSRYGSPAETVHGDGVSVAIRCKARRHSSHAVRQPSLGTHGPRRKPRRRAGLEQLLNLHIGELSRRARGCDRVPVPTPGPVTSDAK